MTTTPNPGSDAALALGCTCPVIDNGHGRGLDPRGFWITEGCPVHAPFPRAALPADEPHGSE